MREQGSFGSVGDDLFETLEDCSKESYSSQVWNGQSRLQTCNDAGCFRIKITG